MTGTSILDTLTGLGSAALDTENIEEADIAIPEMCIMCKNNIVCSLISTFANMSRIGIIICIKKCPFHIELKIDKNG